MSSIMKQLIEYEGISETALSEKYSKTFKQFIVTKILNIPKTKPDIEQIVKISVFDIKINTRIIRTPVGTSLEGVKLTGWKMMVNGEMCLRVQYVADVPEQSVHVAHTKIQFSNFVVIPESLAKIPNVFTNVYVEDIFSNQLDLRNIYNSITVLVTVNY